MQLSTYTISFIVGFPIHLEVFRGLCPTLF